MNRYIRLIVVACLALVNVSAWGETLYFINSEHYDNIDTAPENWYDIDKWYKLDGQGNFVAAGRHPAFNANGYNYVDDVIIYEGVAICKNKPDKDRLMSVTIESGATVVFYCEMIIGNYLGRLEVKGNLIAHDNVYANPMLIGEEAIVVCDGSLDVGNKLGELKVKGSLSVGGDLKASPLVIEKGAAVVCHGSVDVGNSNGRLEVKGTLNVDEDLKAAPLVIEQGGSVVCDDLKLSWGLGELQLSGSLEVKGSFESGEIIVPSSDGVEFIVDISKVAHVKDWGTTSTTAIREYLQSVGVVPIEVEYSEWIGKTDDWYSADNWTKGTPSKNHKLVIENGAFNPEMGAGSSVVREINIKGSKKLTLSSGANLSISKSLIVAGTVTISGANTTMTVTDIDVQSGGNFEINYDVDANPNVVIYSSLTGNITVNRTLETGRMYYIGSATEEGTIEANDWTRSNLYYSYPNLSANPQVYVNKHNTTAFVKYGSETIAETSTTMGRSATSPDKSTFTQVGTIQRALELSNIPTYIGSSWYSNPYPFSLELSKDLLSFVNEDAVQSSLYTRVCVGGVWQFQTFNLSTGVPITDSFNALAPFQGFCVLSHGEVPTKMTISPKFSPDKSNTTLKSASIDMTTGNVLRLYVSMDKYDDVLALLLNEEGQLSLIPGDSEKMNGHSGKINISTNKGGKPLVISHFPSAEQLADENLTIPIEISKSAISGDLVVWANVSNFAYEGDIFLVDNLTGDKVNLKEIDKYTCSDVNNLYSGRFELSFGNIEHDASGTQTDIQNVISDSERVAIGVNEMGKVRVTIFGDVDENATINVYDMLGRVVASERISGRVVVVDVNTKGVAVVQVKNGQTIKSEKIIL